MKKTNVIKEMVSCIVPVYNTDKYVYDCLESLRNQTYKKIELIVIDDGSTDNSLSEIKRFCDDNLDRFYNIHIKQHEFNKGLCAAINTGLRGVNGEYVMWFDSDDLLDENCIAQKIEYLKENPNIQCVMAEADCFDETGKFDYKLGGRPIVGNWFDSFLLGYCDMSPGLNLTYTNTLLSALPETGLRTDIKEQNWYMMLMLASYANIGHLDKILYHYRVRSDSDSHKNSVQTGIEFKQFWDSVDKLRFHAIDDCKLLSIYKCRAYGLQLKNSIADRLSTIDDYQLQYDIDYVQFVVDYYLQMGEIALNAGYRKIFIWGCSDKKRRLKKIFENRINVVGFISSYEYEIGGDVISGTSISHNNIFIIIPLLYHKEIIDMLEKAEFVNHRDFFYPKADLYINAKNHTYLDI